MERRQFIQYGLTGLAAILVNAPAGIPKIFRESEALAAAQTVDLTFSEAIIEMVDFTQVYFWAFQTPTLGPRVPGPIILANEGDPITVKLTNALDEPHAFSIPGVVDSGPILPGESKVITFTAPKAGTYLYLDPLNAPVNRVLGLQGAMIVSPVSGNTPYSSPTPNAQSLFNDLGNSPHFPGNPWNPARYWIWLLNNIDPNFNTLALNNQFISPADLKQNFLPRYFTINGRSGFFSAKNPDTAPEGRVGEPALIRILNAGLAIHSLHIHGNHVYVLALNGLVQKNIFLVDTFLVRPMQRMDWLLPFIKPPDIPPAANWPPTEELNLILGGVRQSPLGFPMHDHTEMSQTAAGGNYPLGMVTDWEITGDITLPGGPVDFPK